MSWYAQPYVGSVETAAGPFWRLAPPGRYVTLRRPLDAVLASLRRGGMMFDTDTMAAVLRHQERKLDQIEKRLPNVLRVTFDELAYEDACADIFEHCLGLDHDSAWWHELASVNIQISLPVMMRYYRAYLPQLDKLAKLAKHRAIAQMRPNGREYDGMDIGVEDFDTWYGDATALLAQHSVLVGEAPDYGEVANEPLGRRLDELGMLMVTTARSNGRLFGYLVTILSPSLEYRDRIIATHTTFYASPDAPGLGMRIQRVARDILRARGVSEVQMRAGIRGDGPRLGTLFRRLGAQEAGQLYRLAL